MFEVIESTWFLSRSGVGRVPVAVPPRESSGSRTMTLLGDRRDCRVATAGSAIPLIRGAGRSWAVHEKPRASRRPFNSPQRYP